MIFPSNPSCHCISTDDDIPETDSAELKTNEVDSNAELDEYMNEIQYQAHKPRMDDEVELQNYLSCTLPTSESGVLHGGKIALQLLYEKRTWLSCDSSHQHCAKTHCPQLYMQRDDWKNCPAEVFKIYRAAGPGTVEVGDVVGLYVGDGKWFSVYQASGGRHMSPCPGTPSTQHGFATTGKWSECSGEDFQIYAYRKEIGDPIQDHDNIFLYYAKDEKWVAFAGEHSSLAPCLGVK